MHIIQQKLLNLAKERNLADLTLRKTGELIGETGSPQKIKHHLDKLLEKGLLMVSGGGKTLKAVSSGIDEKSKLISLPIYGSANCGEPLEFAEQKIEGYLKISKSVLGSQFFKRIDDLFVLRAVGNSMNKANIHEKNIEDGDYIIIDKRIHQPASGEYVVSVIDGAANIKKFFYDGLKKQIVLMSESSQNIPPIFIHQDDCVNYAVCGKVVDVMKQPDEISLMRDVSAYDILNDLGPISDDEVNYYKSL